MPETHQEMVHCPFCRYEFLLATNVLVVSCIQCLKRFIPEFQITKDSSQPKATATANISESEWGAKKDKKTITAIPIFPDQEEHTTDELILTPVQITRFQTHFESEIRLLTTIESAEFTEKILSKINLEGESLVGHILFKVEKKIAEGGMGTVYRAKMVCADGFEKMVALKTLRPKYADDPKLLSMFISEARIMAELKHHNIAAIHSFGKFKGLYFYAMEYIEGRDLYAFQKRHQKLSRSAPIGILVYVIAQICNALSYIHTKRDNRGKPLELIHRDISPQNIMFSADGVVKVMDFGVAKGKPIATSKQKTLAGKLNYTAPEIALFQEVDHRADIYSLGVVFYELVTGRLPFHWKDALQMNLNIEHSDFEPPSKYASYLPEEVERIILKAMAKEPKNRWADATTMGFALNRYLYSKGLLLNERSLSDYLKGIFVNWGHSGIAISQQEDRVDLELVQMAVEKQYVTREQLMDCLKEQADFYSRGEYVNLGAILVDNQHISIQQFQDLLKEQQIEVLRCSICGNQYYVNASSSHKNQDCLRCASVLQKTSVLESALVDGQLLEK